MFWQKGTIQVTWLVFQINAVIGIYTYIYIHTECLCEPSQTLASTLIILAVVTRCVIFTQTLSINKCVHGEFTIQSR